MQKIDPFFKLSTRKQILNILNPPNEKNKRKDKMNKSNQGSNQVSKQGSNQGSKQGSNKGLYNIHDEFYNFYKNLRFPRNPVTVSVYIPSVHVRYTNSAIFHVFDMNFGIVDRIDTVSVKTKDGKSTNFKSVFVYFIVPSDNTFVTEIQERGSIRINPNINTDYMNRHFYQTNNKIRNSEFWMLLPNNSAVPYTNLSLDQIEAKMTELEHKVASDVEELAALNANREFLVELRSKQNREMPPYKDNSINVHQLAQNIKLMEDRVELLQKEEI